MKLVYHSNKLCNLSVHQEVLQKGVMVIWDYFQLELLPVALSPLLSFLFASPLLLVLPPPFPFLLAFLFPLDISPFPLSSPLSRIIDDLVFSVARRT